MKRTIIKIEFEEGFPLDIEVNGKELATVTERAVFYVVLVLFALGGGWLVLYILFPLVWFVLKLLFSIVSFGFILLGVILTVVIVIALIKWQFNTRRKDDFWDD